MDPTITHTAMLTAWLAAPRKGKVARRLAWVLRDWLAKGGFPPAGLTYEQACADIRRVLGPTPTR